MTQFGLNPGFVRFRYDDTHRTHWATYQVDPSGVITAGVEPSFAIKGGGDALMSVCIAGWTAALATQLAAASGTVLAEFWSKPTASDDPVWIYAVATPQSGTGGGTETFVKQVNRSFRTGAGHLMRNVVVGISTSVGDDTVAPLPPTDDLAEYLLSDDNWIMGRDNSFPVAPLNYSIKTNDVLRAKELGL